MVFDEFEGLEVVRLFISFLNSIKDGRRRNFYFKHSYEERYNAQVEKFA